MGSDKNNRTVIIRHATYSQYQEVERIRVRPQHVPNLLPIQALDPGKMPSSVKRILADGSSGSSDLTRKKLLGVW